MKWYPIETCPKDGQMFVVRAINVQPIPNVDRLYTSDPYCVWYSKNEMVGDDRFNNRTHFMRWPHAYQPTHWTPLPSVNDVECQYDTMP